MPKRNVPNPGSKEALKKGCACAVLDNHRGKGFVMVEGRPLFWINSECKVHGKGSGFLDGT